MRNLQRLLASAVVLAAASSFAASSTPASASAPPGPGMGMRMGPGMGPSSGGMGPASGPAMRRGMHGRWNDRSSPGWSMMSAQERQEHQARLSSFKSYDECKAYLDQHHQDMMARAASQNRPMPAHPPYDACSRLKK